MSGLDGRNTLVMTGHWVSGCSGPFIWVDDKLSWKLQESSFLLLWPFLCSREKKEMPQSSIYVMPPWRALISHTVLWGSLGGRWSSENMKRNPLTPSLGGEWLLLESTVDLQLSSHLTGCCKLGQTPTGTHNFTHTGFLVFSLLGCKYCTVGSG
jgi:hypothetical protein